MTVIWLVSDLHLEDLDHATWDPKVRPEFDVLACAGDIVQSDPAACVDVVARLAAGRPAVTVLGNHDVWDRDVRAAVELARSRHPNVHVLDGDGVTLAGVRFAGGTLWDDPDDWPPGIPRVRATPATLLGEPVWLRDGAGPRRATLADVASEHARTLAAVVAYVPDVVLTHYPPSAADLDAVRGPVRWLCGHVHSLQVGRTGRHQVVRVPARRDVDLVGATVDTVTGRVTPVVGLSGTFVARVDDEEDLASLLRSR